MDYESLIADLQEISQNDIISIYKRSTCAAAATALSTLQAENESLRVLVELGNTRAKDYRVMRDRAVKAETENEKLRAELENYRKGHCSEGGCAAEKDRDAVLAELEQVKAERDAAVKDLNEFLAMDELCPIQCEWCKWKDTFCDGKTPEWRGVQNE